MIFLGFNLILFLGGILIGGIFLHKKATNEKEYIYVDTSGIKSNPPEHYIDVELNKTINFKLDKWTISICHLPIKYNIKYLEKIKLVYQLIVKEMDFTPTGKMSELAHQLRIKALYRHATQIIYDLSKHFVKSKRKYRKALFKEAVSNSDFTMDIVEQAVDFWVYRKKKALLLAQGQTLLATVGSAYTWNSYKMDSHGKQLIKPRYARYYATDGTETTPSKEKTNSKKEVSSGSR